MTTEHESTELDKTYDPHLVEDRWYQFWKNEGFFAARTDTDKPPYSLVIPPPNVTGSLHMGHALNNTLQDILARYRRLKGDNVLWMPGTDHAGIATQNVVERQLHEEGIDRHDLGRKQFIERVWRWREESGRTILNQLRRLGASCDWDRERFTMDEGLSQAVREVFVTLYEDGLIYQGDYIINWCPRCHTALSDLEVEYEEHQGALWEFKYPLADGSGEIIVATTRPETMLGDTAVAVNPEDERYREMLGKQVILPLMNRPIPIIADSYVDREFGSGAVKITPAHDPNDFEVGQRHNLESIKVMDEQGRMNENAGTYQGLSREECRTRVVKDLEELGLVNRILPYGHNVGHCYRCRTVIEPYLSNQWFVKIKPLADEAIAAVRQGKTRIIPASWEKTYFNWMENIRDWCISRQIWWGHRIPAWYCQECDEIIVSRTDPDRCPACQSTNLEQETDVLDTWFSSALWPFSTMGWPEKTKELALFYPTSVLVTGFDILFFWVARMMMMGLKFMGDVPFRDVYIHALVRDEQGHKMSKSRGNVIDPLIMIDKYGTDALRFTLTAFAAQGRDVNLSEARISGYRNFCNKIWNAARFALMNLHDFSPETPVDQVDYSLADRWIRHRLHETIAAVDSALADYRFNDAAHAIYQFTWHEFCDWYLELIKPDLFQDADQQRRAASQAVLLATLSALVRLLHPIMPFISEEIWQKLPGTEGSIMAASFPVFEETSLQPKAAADMELVMAVIGGIRNIRGEMGIAPSQKMTAMVRSTAPETIVTIETAEPSIRNLARLQSFSILKDNEPVPAKAASALAAGVEIYVPLAGLIDFELETTRLTKELNKAIKELAQVEKKLANEKFLANAPEDVVLKEKGKQEELAAKAAKFRESLEKIQQLAAG
ncbi:MAG: valine--tRNA ligase [Deltaproteobacteria bacterium]|nr:valine--tRNA ligase [Candidatus Anaeroferrophillus wilburensis]MBN2889390.1 valine--tRNA ligase [Deltaproteobacteria bacterium]